MLSPQDMQLVQEWQEAGFALNLVMRGMQKGALALFRRQLPLKSLRSLQTAVHKEIFPAGKSRRPRLDRAQSFRASMQAMQGPPRCSAAALQRLLAEEQAQLELLRPALAGFDRLLAVLDQLELELKRLPAAPGEPVSVLLGLSRRFYLQLWEVLPPRDRQQLLSDVAEAQRSVRADGEALGSDHNRDPSVAAGPSQAHAVDEALLLSLLRTRLNLLEPSRILQLWDESE